MLGILTVILVLGGLAIVGLLAPENTYTDSKKKYVKGLDQTLVNKGIKAFTIREKRYILGNRQISKDMLNDQIRATVGRCGHGKEVSRFKLVMRRYV